MHWWDNETGGDALSAGHSQAHHRWGMSQHSSLTQVVQSRLDVFRILRLSADLHRTQTLWNWPGQAQRVREPGDKQSKRRWFDDVRTCVCGQWVNWGTQLCRPLQENLRHYVDHIFRVITTSGVRCPTVMCDIFFSLRESAATRFQGNTLLEKLLSIVRWCHRLCRPHLLGFCNCNPCI